MMNDGRMNLQVKANCRGRGYVTEYGFSTERLSRLNTLAVSESRVSAVRWPGRTTPSLGERHAGQFFTAATNYPRLKHKPFVELLP